MRISVKKWDEADFISWRSSHTLLRSSQVYELNALSKHWADTQWATLLTSWLGPTQMSNTCSAQCKFPLARDDFLFAKMFWVLKQWRRSGTHIRVLTYVMFPKYKKIEAQIHLTKGCTWNISALGSGPMCEPCELSITKDGLSLCVTWFPSCSCPVIFSVCQWSPQQLHISCGTWAVWYLSGDRQGEHGPSSRGGGARCVTLPPFTLNTASVPKQLVRLC